MKKITLLLSMAFSFCIVLQAQNTGIGTTAPTLALHVSNPADSALVLLENRTALSPNANVGLYFKNGNYFTGAVKTIGTSNNAARLGLFTFSAPNQNNLVERLSISDNGNVGIRTTAPAANLDINGTMRLQGNGAAAGKVLTSDASGNASWQTPAVASVGFSAHLTSNVPLSNTDYTPTGFEEDFEDGGNNFNASTGVFTAPSAGVYQFTANIGWGSAPAGTNIYYQTRIILVKFGGGSDIIAQAGQPITGISGYGINLPVSVVYKLSAGDKINLEVLHTNAAIITLSGNGSTATTFSGVKLY